MNEPFVRWDWIWDHMDQVGERLIEHVQLTVIAVVLGLLISLPLGLIAYRYRKSYAPIAGVTGILYTIPSLALLAFLVPFTGFSTTTAEVALVSYTLLILIRNIVSGLDGVPEDVKEAAKGMGYSSRQSLWRIEIPLALPVIAAGIRVATVTTIGLVTVTALIGKGGLGYFILLGIRGLFPTPALLGSVLSVALAIAVDAVLLGGQKLVTPWTRVAAARSEA